jgi:hypothetical protein
MKSTVLLGALIVPLVLFVSCDGSPLGSPTPESEAPGNFPSPRPPRPPTNFPPLSGPSRTFVFHSELSYPVRDFTKQSRFVLYDNGAFELRYPHLADGTYHGAYEEDNGVVAFSWDATGRLSNGELAVDFSEQSEQADFEDAIYVLMP